jgi:hypothetical protein
VLELAASDSAYFKNLTNQLQDLRSDYEMFVMCPSLRDGATKRIELLYPDMDKTYEAYAYHKGSVRRLPIPGPCKGADHVPPEFD